MIPTAIGIAVAIISLFLLWRSTAQAMFGFLIVSSILGGSAAIALPMLGGSSIPPVTFCLAFLIARLALPGSGMGPLMREGLSANVFLLVFALYGVVMAFIGPHIFAAAIKVVPMKGSDTNIYATYPLAFSSQNITASVYLVASLMTATCAYAVGRLPGSEKTLLFAGVTASLLHIFFGVSSVAFAHTPFTVVLDFFRNGSYAQLDQGIAGFVRMSGIMPEPSAFAGYAFLWFVFLTECWYRSVKPRLTGSVALAMLLTLLASTSSTAYVSVAAYALIFPVRIVLVPACLPFSKMMTLTALMLGGVALFCISLLTIPAVLHLVGSLLLDLTVNKGASTSGIQRALWARQGFTAFSASAGLGVGPGSFRSSSIATAIWGTTGLMGTASFATYLIAVIKPWRSSTYHRVISTRDAIGVAAAWAAVASLIPACIGSPTADPGANFAIFAGMALALRRREAPLAAPARSREIEANERSRQLRVSRKMAAIARRSSAPI